MVNYFDLWGRLDALDAIKIKYLAMIITNIFIYNYVYRSISTQIYLDIYVMVDHD